MFHPLSPLWVRPQMYNKFASSWCSGPSCIKSGWHYLLDKLLSSGCDCKTFCAIHWIEIYPVDSVIQPSNNWDQMCNKFAQPFENFFESFNSFLGNLMFSVKIVIYFHQHPISQLNHKKVWSTCRFLAMFTNA